MTEEEILGTPHADVGLQGQATETREHARTAAAAELVPDEINRRRHTAIAPTMSQTLAPPLGRERANGQKGRKRWQGDPDLLGHDEDRQEDRTIALEPLETVVQLHALGLAWDGTIRTSRRQVPGAGHRGR